MTPSKMRFSSAHRGALEQVLTAGRARACVASLEGLLGSTLAKVISAGMDDHGSLKIYVSN